MNNIKIAILGRNYTSLLGMIRAVGELNFDITVIKTVPNYSKPSHLKRFIKKMVYDKDIEASSKYVKEYVCINQKSSIIVDMLRSLVTSSEDVIILLPTDDFTTSVIDSNQDLLRKNFIFPNIDNETGKIVAYMDKNKQKQLAKKAGLLVADGKVLELVDGKYSIPLDINYPVFTKPQVSFKGDKTFMKKCDNKKELNELLKSIPTSLKCPILVEEYIEIEKEYAILGCSVNDEVIMPGIIQMLKSGNGAHKGVTMLGKIKPLNENKTLVNSLEKFIKNLGFSGLFDIDLYESNGKIYFNELNLRFGASGYAITAAGVNLPEFYVKKVLNENATELQDIKESHFVNEKVCLDDYSQGFMNYKEYKKIINDSDIRFIKNNSDTNPYKIFKRKEMITRIKRKLK